METNGQKETEKPKVEVELENLGTVNKNQVDIATPKGHLTLYFSYSIIVSFKLRCKDYYDDKTRKNSWGNTTGKLLNDCCPNKDRRVEEHVFKEALAQAFNRVF